MPQPASLLGWMRERLNSGGGGGGSGGSGPGGGSGAPGSRENPVVVEVAGSRASLLATAVRYALWGGLAYVLYLQLSGKGAAGPSGVLAQLTGESVEEVTEVPATRFSDVKGADEAKAELEDVVNFLRDPEKYRRLGAKVPRGVLLTGPPGTGKTLLARAVAGEAGCKFYNKTASEFEEMLVGLGARRVRDLFAAARKNAPAIIFLDEIDALGGKRKMTIGGSGAERQTLNQLLSSMDGFAKNENVIVIAATNAPEILDPALVRPGRFDTTVDVPLPDVKGRKAIIEHYLRKIVVRKDIDSSLLARATPGFSGAQLEAMVNSAALIAANRGADLVEMPDMEEARDKVIMGACGPRCWRAARAAAVFARRRCPATRCLRRAILAAAPSRRRPRAAVQGAAGKELAADGVPRGRPHAGGAADAGRRPGAQGDHFAARLFGRRDLLAAARRGLPHAAKRARRH